MDGRAVSSSLEFLYNVNMIDLSCWFANFIQPFSLFCQQQAIWFEATQTPHKNSSTENKTLININRLAYTQWLCSVYYAKLTINKSSGFFVWCARDINLLWPSNSSCIWFLQCKWNGTVTLRTNIMYGESSLINVFGCYLMMRTSRIE